MGRLLKNYERPTLNIEWEKIKKHRRGVDGGWGTEVSEGLGEQISFWFGDYVYQASTIWNFLDSSNSKNSNFHRLLDRLTALADLKLPVDVLQVSFDGCC